MYFLRCELDLRASHALVASQTGRCRSSEPWVSANTNGFSFTPFFTVLYAPYLSRFAPISVLELSMNCVKTVLVLSAVRWKNNRLLMSQTLQI